MNWDLILYLKISVLIPKLIFPPVIKKWQNSAPCNRYPPTHLSLFFLIFVLNYKISQMVKRAELLSSRPVLQYRIFLTVTKQVFHPRIQFRLYTSRKVSVMAPYVLQATNSSLNNNVLKNDYKMEAREVLLCYRNFSLSIPILCQENNVNENVD